MRRLLSIIFLTLTVFIAAGQSQYSRVKLFANHNQLLALASDGLIIDHGIFKEGVYVICELSDAELNIVDEAGIQYEVMIRDLTKFYRERNEKELTQLDDLERMVYNLSDEWPVPEGFELGTCGGFLTLDQALQHLDTMAYLYPELISPKYTLDYNTFKDRELYWVRLSDNPTIDENEPEVLYTGMHHGREPIGMQLLVYYMYYLLENYNTDPDVQYIVDNFELYFIPIVNPDGYAYNIQNQPNGGGMWRKNRRQNDDGSYGVDINRNYSYMWAYDDYGSSPNPESGTYRGTEAFSEPESKCIRDFCEEHGFKIALNYHSFSNKLLYPWSYFNEPSPHDEIFYAHGKILTTENGYAFGAGGAIHYPTNGNSDDWMYGEQTTKSLIYAYTPEVADGIAGFWPPVSQIIPLCQENMFQNMMAAKFSGPWATASDISPSIIEYKSGLFFIKLRRLGLQDGATFTVSIEPLNDAIETISTPLVFDSLDILETASAAFLFTLKDDIISGDRVEYLLSVNNGIATFSDTISKIFGTPVVIFQDSASNFDNWSSEKWNITTTQSHSPTTSITDSPIGQYLDNENNGITLVNPIDLSDVVYASLGFWTKWDIEEGYDYTQLFISDDDGLNWTPIKGKYTNPGNYVQAYGEPLYDGTQTTWVKEEINLEPYLGNQIKIQFVLRSNTFVVADGFFWDDMTVTVVEDLAIGNGDEGDKSGIGNYSFARIVPNPASGHVRVDYNLINTGPGEKAFKIFNLNGQQVCEIVLEGETGEIGLDVSSWLPGIYFYAVFSNRAVTESGKLIVK